jgi:hypothetical protein
MYGYVDIQKIRADAGSQFTSDEFSTFCRDAGIHLTLAALKKQYQNHLAERTWQSISNIGRSLLVHARLPDTFMYHALVYACHIFNVLPIRGLQNDDDIPATPYQLFFDKRPMISNYRVFGCPTVVKRSGKQTERGTRGIIIGFHSNHKGYLIYSPGSRQIMISGDVHFDESFFSAVATTWQQHKDSLALKPVDHHISKNMQCLFLQHYNDGSKVHLLNYVDDMLYYGTSKSRIKQFEELLTQRFNVELMGQAHWYLATRINQLSNYDIELDQSRYCKSIVKKCLDTAGCKKIISHHSTPLPLDFIPTSEDCSVDEDASKLLEQEYNIEYASCIGSLIYLAMTRCDITFAVNKLAKYSKKPGKAHFEAMLHTL